MPELPEVETVKKGLNKLVKGKIIEAVYILWPKIIEFPSLDEFQNQLVGEKIESVSRRGKFLIFHFTHWDMLSHLRMEGKYEIHSAQEIPTKHCHVVFSFTDCSSLWYLDVRKFGRMVLLPKGEALGYSSIRKLGPEPLSDDFLLSTFQMELQKKAKAIKPLLLEQKIVTGLGNIYVDEALFEAGIHPEQPACTLTKRETEKLYHAIRYVLQQAVEAGGTTIRTYQNALGEAGSFQVELHVYGQTGQPCINCGTSIQKIVVGQRGTHFCPTCQKIKVRKTRSNQK